MGSQAARRVVAALVAGMVGVVLGLGLPSLPGAAAAPSVVDTGERCRRDADCVAAPPAPCGCPDCVPRAVNRAYARQLRNMAATVDCASASPPQSCPTCAAMPPSRFACVRRRCTLLPAKQPRSRSRRCRRDRDCTLQSPYEWCRCRPCGAVWSQSLNRKVAEQMRPRHTSRKVVCGLHEKQCPKCPRKVLGSEAICLKRQCTVR